MNTEEYEIRVNLLTQIAKNIHEMFKGYKLTTTESKSVINCLYSYILAYEKLSEEDLNEDLQEFCNNVLIFLNNIEDEESE